MLLILFLVECVEVAREGLRYNWVNNWLGRSWTAVQLEGLIILLVGCLEFEFLRLIVRHST